MPDKITAKERAAILAFRGPVQRCPDGEAMNAHLPWVNDPYETWLSRIGINVVPLSEQVFQYHLRVKGGTSTDTRLKRAA